MAIASGGGQWWIWNFHWERSIIPAIYVQSNISNKTWHEISLVVWELHLNIVFYKKYSVCLIWKGLENNCRGSQCCKGKSPYSPLAIAIVVLLYLVGWYAFIATGFAARVFRVNHCELYIGCISQAVIALWRWQLQAFILIAKFTNIHDLSSL